MQYHDISADLFPEAPTEEEILQTARRPSCGPDCRCLILILLLACCCRN